MRNSPSEILNKNVMVDLIGNEPETIRKFEVEFIKQAHASMKSIIAQYKQDDFNQIKETAHFLKTSARAVGAEQTGDLLESLEKIALMKDKAQCKEHIILINNAIKQVYEVIINEN
ncbi:MAG: Hpt domain-containing protein [Thalassotalea sp.]